MKKPGEFLSETVKLLQIIVSALITSGESEQCFPALKRIKTFMRNVMKKDCLCIPNVFDRKAAVGIIRLQLIHHRTNLQHIKTEGWFCIQTE